jgi:carboxymethylenebutenolidase
VLGGAIAIQVAATNPDTKAAVAWYGAPGRPLESASGPVSGFDVAKDIKSPFLGLFGGKDQNPKPDDAQRFGEMLRQNGNKNVEIVIYPESGHAFHADYRPSYNKADADDAWKRCTAWFEKYWKA